MGVLSTAATALACPTCKNALAGHDHIVQGYFWSILFMMSMPFLLLGSFTAYMYWEVRKARAQQAASRQANQPAAPSSENREPIGV